MYKTKVIGVERSYTREEFEEVSGRGRVIGALDETLYFPANSYPFAESNLVFLVYSSTISR